MTILFMGSIGFMKFNNMYLRKMYASIGFEEIKEIDF